MKNDHQLSLCKVNVVNQYILIILKTVISIPIVAVGMQHGFNVISVQKAIMRPLGFNDIVYEA